MSTATPPVDYIAQTTAQYASFGYPPYAWIHSEEPPPFCRLEKPLSRCRIGLIATGGIYLRGQVAFHYKDDLSYRKIAKDTPNASLRTTHFAYDLTDSRNDPGVVFPLAALRELERDGEIGEVAPEALTIMGGIYSARRVREALAPALADELQSQAVDAALLVPV